MDKFINANGLNIHYREEGKGQPLILLHGAMVTHQVWEVHLEELSKHYCVITPDSRGHGQTFNPSRELSYRIMADDLAGLILALELKNPFIFGYSDGGQAVLDFGMRYPDLPGALVVGGVWYRFSEEYREAISRSGFVSPGVVDWDVYKQQAPQDWELRLRTAHPDPDPDYPRILLESLARLWWTPLNYTKNDFKKIIAPTMILMGELEEIIPLDEAREIAAFIPGAELVIIPGANHNDVPKTEGLFQKLVREFINRRFA